MNSDELTKVLVGAQLTLLDDESIEDFGFCPNGNVVATLGTPNGAVCFPVLKYRVTEGGKVEICDGSLPSYTWEEIDLQDGIFSVTCSGFRKRFKFVPPVKRPAPYLP